MLAVAASGMIACTWTLHAGGSGGGLDAGPAQPDGGSPAAERLYKKYCKTCHGGEGHGDGPRAMFLKPKPRNFTRTEDMKSTTEEAIYRVIAEGGAAHGLSAAMPPWQSKLQQGEIRQLVALVRSFPARDSAGRAKARG